MTVTTVKNWISIILKILQNFCVFIKNDLFGSDTAFF